MLTSRKRLKTEELMIEVWVDVMHNILYICWRSFTFTSRLELSRCNNIWEDWIDFISPISSVLI